MNPVRKPERKRSAKPKRTGVSRRGVAAGRSAPPRKAVPERADGQAVPLSDRAAARNHADTSRGVELRPRARLAEWRWIPRAARVFVNRNLRMESIRAIGFDLDHTLAHYDPQPVERLAFNATVKKLVDGGHLPAGVTSLRYQPGQIIRGLVVDRRRGNLLKMDYHNYVTRAYHAETPLTTQERKAAYSQRRLPLSAERYASVDTLFHIPEAYLYQRLVEFMDRNGARGKDSYSRLYSLVRRTIDESHADGSIKSVLTANQDRYLRPDPRLTAVLERLRQAGKKLFLLTNSEFYYTDALLSHLLGEGAGGKKRWQEYFDLIYVEARKPSFFLTGGHGRSDGRRQSKLADSPPVFKGGTGVAFERELGFCGDEVLYFGDHTYGDILRSKKSLGWRTAMIVPELKRELAITESLQSEFELLGEISHEGNQREMELALAEREARKLLRTQESARRSHPANKRRLAERVEAMRESKERLSAEIKRIEQERREHEIRIDAAYHPRWGPLFREGRETSRFGHQVKDFACIYMHRVSCLLNYPVNHYFQSAVDLMPHEL